MTQRRFPGVLLIASAVVGCASQHSTAQVLAWTLRTSEGPSARYAAPMVYDSARRVSVLFGGQQIVGSPLATDTWEWSGTTWVQRSVYGPSPRTGVAMAYDSRRQVTVLFGGNDGAHNGVAFADTWEWNGSTWTQSTPSGITPPARGAHAMAFDSVRGVTVMFGGALTGGGGNVADTWEWNGVTWTQRAVGQPGPAPINGHKLAYDSARGVCVFFGPYLSSNGVSYESQTWEWDGQHWTNKTPSDPNSSPPPRGGMGFAYAPDRGTTVLFGGSSATQYFGDTWEWNGSAWTQASLSGPSPRFQPSFCYHAARHSFVLFAGWTSFSGIGENRETWELSASGCAADLDNGTGSGTPDNGVDINDLLYFLEHFELGC